MAHQRFCMLVMPLLMAACASSPPAGEYWRSASAKSRADFATDNQSCGAAASRKQPTPRADQVAGGVVAPENRIDQPPRPWTNAVAERAYMGCMAERGWTVARR